MCCIALGRDLLALPIYFAGRDEIYCSHLLSFIYHIDSHIFLVETRIPLDPVVYYHFSIPIYLKWIEWGSQFSDTPGPCMSSIPDEACDPPTGFCTENAGRDSTRRATRRPRSNVQLFWANQSQQECCFTPISTIDLFILVHPTGNLLGTWSIPLSNWFITNWTY